MINFEIIVIFSDDKQILILFKNLVRSIGKRLAIFLNNEIIKKKADLLIVR